MTILEAFGVVALLVLGACAGYTAGAFIKGIWEDSDPTLTPSWVTPLGIVLSTVGTLVGAGAGVYFALTT